MNRYAPDGVRCMIMRGGTSKGAYFLAEDLPREPEARNQLLARIMGSPDPRQIDGIGGAHPLTSKVAVVSANEDEMSVDYLFLQVGVEDAVVTDRQNCGNLLAGVGAFAIERGILKASEDVASVRIRMLNTESVATATFPLQGGLPDYQGQTMVDGVPGSAAPVRVDFEDLAGGTCGALLPTGNLLDEFAGVEVTCVDNGMPVVAVRAADVGVTGSEPCDLLEADRRLQGLLRRIRMEAGAAMGLTDVAGLTIPKMTLLAAPRDGGSVLTRTFIPIRCHRAIGVLGAISVATVCALPGTVADGIAQGDLTEVTRIEHPTGTFEASVRIIEAGGGRHTVDRAGIIQTTRKLMDGTVFPRPSHA